MIAVSFEVILMVLAGITLLVFFAAYRAISSGERGKRILGMDCLIILLIAIGYVGMVVWLILGAGRAF